MTDKIKDLILGLVLLTVGSVALIAIRTSEGGTRIESAAKLTYATMPTIYAWVLIVLVALFMLKTLLAMRSEQPLKRQHEDIAPEKSQEAVAVVSSKIILLRTWGTLFILLCYVLALDYIHFLILTLLFLATLFFLYGQRSIKKITAVSVCGGVVYYFLFIYILNLPF
jgi:hypothetical protein